MKLSLMVVALLVLGHVAGDASHWPPQFREQTIQVGQGSRWVSVADVNMAIRTS